MRFLLDECISARLAPLVAEAGHDVVHVSDRGLAGHVDDEVLAAARDEKRVLVSADTDFGELLAKQGLALPSLVFAGALLLAASLTTLGVGLLMA